VKAPTKLTRDEKKMNDVCGHLGLGGLILWNKNHQRTFKIAKPGGAEKLLLNSQAKAKRQDGSFNVGCRKHCFVPPCA